jgi:hypothetical protein
LYGFNTVITYLNLEKWKKWEEEAVFSPKWDEVGGGE